MAERVDIIIEGEDRVSRPAKAASGALTNMGTSAQRATGRMAGLRGALTGLGSSMSGLMAPLGGILRMFGPLLAGFGAIQALRMGVGFLSSIETAQIQFEVLLGSAEKAKDRIQELTEYAARTPFELPEVVSASRQLQVMGGTALATGQNLTMVGDMAAAAQVGFQEIAMWVGRAYSAMQAGRPWGEAAMRLSELGLMSGETRAKLEEMTKAGATSEEVWGAFIQSMGRFEGMMEKQSKTFAGLMSTLADSVNMALGKLMSGLFQQLKSGLEPTIAFIEGPLTSAIEGFGQLFDRLGIGLGPVLAAIGAVLAAVFGPPIIAAIAGFIAAAAPIAALIAGLIGVVTVLQRAWERNWFGIRDIAEQVMQSVGQAINSIGQIINSLKEPIQEAMGFFESMFAAIERGGDVGAELFDGLGSLIRRLVSWIGRQVPVIARQILEWGRAFVEWVAPLIPPLITEMGKMLANMLRWILGTALPAIIGQLAEWGIAFGAWVLRDAIPTLMRELPKIAVAIVRWIALEAVPAVANAALEIGRAIVEGVMSGLADLGRRLWDAFSRAITGVEPLRKEIEETSEAVNELNHSARLAVEGGIAEFNKELNLTEDEMRAIVQQGRGMITSFLGQARAQKESAQSAEENTDQQQRQGEQIAKTAGAAKTAADAHKSLEDAMRGIADIAFPGEAAVSDQLFRMQQQAKQLELQILEMGGRSAEGVEPLERALDNLRREMDIVRLRSEITFDPMQRMLERLVEPVKELGMQQKLNTLLALDPSILANLDAAARAMGMTVQHMIAMPGFQFPSASGFVNDMTVIQNTAGQTVAELNRMQQVEFPAPNPNVTRQWEEWAAARRRADEAVEWGAFTEHLRAIGAPVPTMQFGGTVPGPRGQPQLVMAHGGERVTPAGDVDDHRSVVINVNGQARSGDADMWLSDPRVREYMRPRRRF